MRFARTPKITGKDSVPFMFTIEFNSNSDQYDYNEIYISIIPKSSANIYLHSVNDATQQDKTNNKIYKYWRHFCPKPESNVSL